MWFLELMGNHRFCFPESNEIKKQPNQVDKDEGKGKPRYVCLVTNLNF